MSEEEKKRLFDKINKLNVKFNTIIIIILIVTYSLPIASVACFMVLIFNNINSYVAWILIICSTLISISVNVSSTIICRSFLRQDKCNSYKDALEKMLNK